MVPPESRAAKPHEETFIVHACPSRHHLPRNARDAHHGARKRDRSACQLETGGSRVKSALVIVGMIMFVAGLVALYFGVTSLAATPCYVDQQSCDPNAASNIGFFPAGLASVIVGSISWTAGAGSFSGTGSSRHPLAFIGFFGIFGMTFLGVGLVMFIADQQPTTDHVTNVLTTLGIIFGLVGIISIGVEVASRFATAADEQILATGVRGKATVLASRDSNVTVNNNPMINMDLRVEIPGQPVFTTTVRQVISRLEVGSYRPGLVLSVAADPKKPRNIVIDWDRSPIGDAGPGRDPVTGQPMAAAASPILVNGAPIVTMGGRQVPGGDVASILRAAADQVAAGKSVAHPEVASVVGNAGQCPGSASMSPEYVATLLRSVADRVASGATTVTGAPGTTGTGGTAGAAAAPGFSATSSAADATITSEQLAAMLRHASEAAAQAARQAELSGGIGGTGTLPAGGTTSGAGPAPGTGA